MLLAAALETATGSQRVAELATGAEAIETGIGFAAVAASSAAAATGGGGWALDTLIEPKTGAVATGVPAAGGGSVRTGQRLTVLALALQEVGATEEAESAASQRDIIASSLEEGENWL